MNPLSALYSLGAGAKNYAYDHGWLTPQRLTWPVISVGNLSVGGSGKTPFVILLGQLLRRHGYFITVLSRGYRRESNTVELVDSTGEPARFGDEPLLISRKLNAPVFVGAERYRCGLLAENKFTEYREAGQGKDAHIPRAVHILDDGFQHRLLARSFDIVLLPPEDLKGTLLPTGRLREGLRSLRRAHAVVLTAGTQLDALPDFARENAYVLERSLVIKDTPKRPLAFCGIAKPERFFADLKKLGIQTVAEVTFRDHHRYSPQDIAMLLEKKRPSGADGFVTTEKDRINLGELAARMSPLAVAELRLELQEEERFVKALMAVIAGDHKE